MIRSAQSRNTMLIAGFVALIYASLAAVAASCAFHHVDASNGHTHHRSHEAAPHNALCAWACQATFDTGLVPESPALSMSPIVQLVVSSPNQEPPSFASSLLRSRAPPLGPFVFIG